MSVNIAVGADITLLGARLSAAFAKIGNGYKIMIKPTDVKDNEGITINQMVADVNSLIKSITGDNKPAEISADNIWEKLPMDEENRTGWESIRIKLSMVYLYVESDSGDSSKVMDFAFRLDIDSSDLISKDIKLVRIDSLSLAVWNTENKAVTDQMQLALPEAMTVSK